jgi:cytochrome c oxidase subunit 2
VVAGVCLLAAGATLFAAPVAAQSANRAAIDKLNSQLLYVALPLTLFVEMTLVYAVYRFRNNDDPSPTVDDPGLEITWTVATGVILLFVGLSAYFVTANPYLTPAAATGADDPAAADDLVVEVEAYQWGWSVHYPAANVTTRDRIVLPADRDVRFVLTSRDVIHSIYVPALGIKQDVFPGSEAVARTRATETGEYRLYCAELCGSGHTRMHGQVAVVNGTAYDEWVERRGETRSLDRPARVVGSERPRVSVAHRAGVG